MRRSRLLIAAVTTGSLGLAAAMAFGKPVLFEAAALISVRESTDLEPADPTDLMLSRIALIESPVVLRAAIPNDGQLADPSSTSIPIDVLKERLSFRVRGGTELVDVAFRAPEPTTAIASINTIVEAFRSVSENNHQNRLALREGQLERQIRSQDSSLAVAQVALQLAERVDSPAAAGANAVTNTAGDGVSVETIRAAQRLRTEETLADRFKEEYYSVVVDRATAEPLVQVIALAEGARQVSRRIPITLFLGALAGLLTGTAIGAIRSSLDRSIRRREDVEALLNVPNLAVIPRLDRTDGRYGAPLVGAPTPPANGRQDNGRSTPTDRTGAWYKDATTRAASVQSTDRANTLAAGLEAYRTLRTNLLFRHETDCPRTLLVTSAAAGEGKTTTLANLGLVVAQQGLRVLLIDTDLRNATLAAAFGLPDCPGLTEVLLEDLELETAVRWTGVRDLHLLPAGTSVPNPSELLGGHRMERLQAQLAEQYDLLLLDTPPVLTASDAAVLGTLADGVLLVVLAGGSPRRDVHYVVEQFVLSGTPVLGAVLNDRDGRQSFGRYLRRIVERRGRVSAPQNGSPRNRMPVTT